MRDYSKVSSSIWTGKTGRAIRGDMQTQIVALYLMTSPHANMIGVYHCPVIYIAHETGSPFEGASEGLRRLCEGGFCTYDDDSETVWVHEMARYQIGDELKPSDNRVKDIQKQYENLSEGRIKTGFHARYSTEFHLKEHKPLRSPSEAPPKPEAGTEAEERLPPTPRKRGKVKNEVVNAEGFCQFWSAYPRKKNKGNAETAWSNIGPDAGLVALILEAVEVAKASDDWRREGGKFVPYPASWLNAKGWEDDVGVAAYQPAELAVLTAYNAAMPERGWPEASVDPYSPERAAAIREFATFGHKPDWMRAYFVWLADNLAVRAGCGFDWAIRRDTFIRAREGNFSALREAA